MDTNRWNIAFTNMIRQTNLAAWGNWTLNPSVVPGAVGILDPVTGSFTAVATIPGARIIRLASPESWSVESSSVHKSESDVSFAGGYLDPSSGTTVTAGLDVAWSFSQEGSIVSNATLLGRSLVDDFGSLMQANYPWLLSQAKSVGYATDAGISQGFGMITQVTQCAGGVNIGSLTDNSTFSLTGSVDGINAMTGGGEASAKVKGSYKEADENKSFEKHLWPAETDKVPDADIGISFQFASFAGKLIMPTWIAPLSGFSFLFNNSHGGTYIADCSVEYTSASSGSQKPISTSISVAGGQAHSIGGIPLDAQNVKVTIHLEAGDTFYFKFPTPIASLLNGNAVFDIYGVWPWSGRVEQS